MELGHVGGTQPLVSHFQTQIKMKADNACFAIFKWFGYTLEIYSISKVYFTFMLQHLDFII